MHKPRAFGYGRVSHEDSIEQGDSLPSQARRCQGYFDMFLAPDGVEWGGVDTEDGAVSAWKVPFHRRPAGKRLLSVLRKGDHLIVDKIDRIWRSIEDFVRLTRHLNALGVTVHFVDFRGCSVRTGTPMGDFMLTIMVAVAELEPKIVSQRTRQAHAEQRARGKGCVGGKRPPFGTVIVGSKSKNGDTRRLEWNPQERAIMAQIVELRDNQGLSFEQISVHLEKELAARNGRKFSDSPFFKRHWEPRSVYQAYLRERMYVEYSITDPNKAPPQRIWDANRPKKTRKRDTSHADAI